MSNSRRRTYSVDGGSEDMGRYLGIYPKVLYDMETDTTANFIEGTNVSSGGEGWQLICRYNNLVTDRANVQYSVNTIMSKGSNINDYTHYPFYNLGEAADISERDYELYDLDSKEVILKSFNGVVLDTKTGDIYYIVLHRHETIQSADTYSFYKITSSGKILSYLGDAGSTNSSRVNNMYSWLTSYNGKIYFRYSNSNYSNYSKLGYFRLSDMTIITTNVSYYSLIMAIPF